MTEFVTVCDEGEIAEGDRLIAEIDGKEIGIFHVDGEYFAVLNFCLHQGGPLCEGSSRGTVDAAPGEWEYTWVKEGKLIMCPWHGWEFDLTTGEYLVNKKYKLPTYHVVVDNGQVKIAV